MIKANGFFRVVFFLPFLLGTGSVMQQLMDLGINKEVLSITSSLIIPEDVVFYFGAEFNEMVVTFLSMIVSVLWNSSVQILLFLSGLQVISPSLYEAARVDGATEWEMFWKITIPSLAPVTVLTIIYTIVDTATSDSNTMISLITNSSAGGADLATAAAMSWIYLFVVLAFVGVVLFATRKQHSSAEQ